MRNEYVVLFDRLETFSVVVLALVLPTFVQLVESSELSITYPVIGRPPSDRGALHESETEACPPTALKFRGDEGLFAKLTETE